MLGSMTETSLIIGEVRQDSQSSMADQLQDSYLLTPHGKIL